MPAPRSFVRQSEKARTTPAPCQPGRGLRRTLRLMQGRLWDSPAIAIVVALAVVAGVDAALGALDPPPEIAWVLDEPAHLITAVLALLALPRGMARPFVASTLVAAVAIDLDHLPQYIGWDELTEGAPRPYSHSLVTVGFLVVVAAVASHRGGLIILGAALGVGAHLARDIATGPGIPLLWPLSSSAVTVPHWTYLAGLGLLGAAALRHGRTSARVGMARDRRRRYHRRGG